VPPLDLSELDDRDWNEARRRLELIQPVLDAARLPCRVIGVSAGLRRTQFRRFKTDPPERVFGS